MGNGRALVAAEGMCERSPAALVVDGGGWPMVLGGGVVARGGVGPLGFTAAERELREPEGDVVRSTIMGGEEGRLIGNPRGCVGDAGKGA